MTTTDFRSSVALSGARPSPVISIIRTLAAGRAGLEARMLEAVVILATTTGDTLLREKGFTSVDEMSAYQRRLWRAEVKRCAAAEVQAALGTGKGESADLVGVACAPMELRELLTAALDRGEVTWSMVRSFWNRFGSLEHDTVLLAAQSLFGLDPEVAEVSRLTPDGDLREGPWHRSDYFDALEAEAVRIEGLDVEAERERRRQAYAMRNAVVRVDDDGTATLSVTGSLPGIAGVHARIDHAARLARKAGDQRTLDQLRADLCVALMLHGSLPMEGSETECGGAVAQQVSLDEVAVEKVSPLAEVINTLPPMALQVVVSQDVLTGRPDLSIVRGQAPGPGSVAMLLGPVPSYISPGHARELALAPGTTLHRLLTDPADRRLVERSVTTYRPDADMRRQVVMADLFSRAPGSTIPARACELDHVVPFGGATDGPTSETNLVALNKGAHDDKTHGRVRTKILPRRDMLWVTLLGQATTTRVHDYRRYRPGRPWLCRSTDAVPSPGIGEEAVVEAVETQMQRVTTGRGGAEKPDGPLTLEERLALELERRRDLVARALYAALVHRGPRAALLDDDDIPAAAAPGGHLDGWCYLTHRTATGQRRDGPPDEYLTPAEVLGVAIDDARGEDTPGGGAAGEGGTAGDWNTDRGGGADRKGGTDGDGTGWTDGFDGPPPF